METGAVDGAEGRVDIGYFILEGGEVSANLVAEVTDLVAPSEFEFDTGILYVAGVHRGGGVTHHG